MTEEKPGGPAENTKQSTGFSLQLTADVELVSTPFAITPVTLRGTAP
jgi:hypothetical protein